MNCVPPSSVPKTVPNVNLIKNSQEPIFLRTILYDENNQKIILHVLPDSGNRAKCIMQYNTFKELYPNLELEPVEDKITTAKKNDFLEIIGTPKKPIKFFIANENFVYNTRPLIAKRLQLPCLFSAHDMEQMKMKIDYAKKEVTLGNLQHKTQLEPLPKSSKANQVSTIYKENILALEEAIIPVVLDTEVPIGNLVLIQADKEFEDEYEIVCAASLDTTRETRIAHIKMMNFSDHPITIKPGTKIGTVINVNEIEPEKNRTRTDELEPNRKEILSKWSEDLKMKENKHLNSNQKNELLNLLFEYRSVISKGSADIGQCKEVECHIPTEEGKTVKAQCRPLPPHLKQNFKEQLDAWIEKGIVEKAPPGCPFSSPLVPVKKKNGQIRWAVDYRQLNNISRKDHRPIPNVFERLSSLKATFRKPLRYYGCLDLQDAFHNIPIAEDSKDKTSVITPFGLFRFLRMPFGLHGAPQAFAEMIRILEDRLERADPLAQQILIYFDDCLICGSTWKEFLKLLRTFLQQLKIMNLKINLKKCQLGLPSIKWLGHDISDQGISPAKELTRTIKDWPEPTNVNELRSLFGTISYYRRFIADFATKTKFMRKLLLKDSKFEWTPDHQQELDKLKETLCTKPILGHPDFTKNSQPFIVYVDSSKVGVGAILAQPQEIEHKGEKRIEEIVIAYASKSLTTGEQHYSAYKKELLGVVYALTHFRYYLLGKEFIIRTDHKALEWLMKTRTTGAPSLLYRWQDVLSEYDFKIEYVPGKRMQHVDGLSRKTYKEGDFGTIRDLPDFNIAQISTDDNFWLPKVKTKIDSNSIQMLDRPKRTIKAPQRYSPSNYNKNSSSFQATPAENWQHQPQKLATPANDRQHQPSNLELSNNEQIDELLEFDDNEPIIDPNVEGFETTWNEVMLEDNNQQSNHFDRNTSDELSSTPITTSTLTNPFIGIDGTPKDKLRHLQLSDTLLAPIFAFVQSKATDKPMTVDDLKHKLFRIQKSKPITDEQINQILHYKDKFFIDPNNLLLKIHQAEKEHLVLPMKLISNILMVSHDHETMIHPGQTRTEKIIRDRVWWPNIINDIKNYVRNCNTCKRKQRTPDNNTQTYGQTTSREVPKLSKWSCDIVSFKEPSGIRRFKHLLTMMDYNTRWLEAYPISDDTAKTIVNTIKTKFVPIYGLGKTFQTDQGRNFMSKQFAEACEQLGCYHHKTITYNPQANPVERAHREINQKLRILLENQPENKWSFELDKALLSYRTLPTTTGPSPYYLLFGVHPRLAIDLFLDGQSVGTDTFSSDREGSVEQNEQNDLSLSEQMEQNDLPEIANILEHKKSKITSRHEQNLKQLQNKMERSHKVLQKFNRGDLIDLWRPLDRIPTRSRRFTRHWSGPYTILDIDSKNPFRIFIGNNNEQLGTKWTKAVSINHVRHHGRIKIDHPIMHAWSPFAPPMNKKQLSNRNIDKWIAQERRTNMKIPNEILQKANEPPKLQKQKHLQVDIDDDEIPQINFEPMPRTNYEPIMIPGKENEQTNEPIQMELENTIPLRGDTIQQQTPLTPRTAAKRIRSPELSKAKNWKEYKRIKETTDMETSYLGVYNLSYDTATKIQQSTQKEIPLNLRLFDTTEREVFFLDEVTKGLILKFIENCKQNKIMSFDTEGQPEAQMLQLGNLNGTVLIFQPKRNEITKEYDWTKFPTELIQILKDPNIIKIQSDPFRDKMLLNQIGIHVEGLVDLRLVFKITEEYQRDQPKTSMRTITENLLKATYNELPWNLEWHRKSIRSNNRALKHIIQDVRVPLLVILKLAQRMKNKNNKNLIQKAQELSIKFVNINQNPLKWKPSNDFYLF